MPSIPLPSRPPKFSSNLLRRTGEAIGRRSRASLGTLVRTAKDPILPALILGSAAAAVFARFVLSATAEIVFGLLFAGCLTAILETKARNWKRDPE
jgi:hypothetical protein